MDQYIARQPIFTEHLKLFGYELLYWGPEFAFPEGMNGDQATTSLLSSIFLTRDVEEMTRQRPCFINFTQNLLEKNIPAVFPKNKVMIEILETVEPTEKVVAVCRSLRKDGYLIALDDFIYHPKFHPLLELAEIVKIDFRATSLQQRIKLTAQLRPFKVKLLAEKVETRTEFEEGLKLGFHYFQGFFFCKPEKVAVRNFSTNEMIMLQLLAEVNSPQTDLDRLHAIISTDAALSYKLLRFINSAYFYRIQPVSSLKHAVVYLGERELRRFVMFMVISEMGKESPAELIAMSLIRAKFCETLAERSSWEEKACSEMFLVGLFSLLETITGAPMAEILNRLPIAKAVHAALTQQDNRYARCLQLIIALEKNDQPTLDSLCAELKIGGELLKECYILAVKYANGVL